MSCIAYVGGLWALLIAIWTRSSIGDKIFKGYTHFQLTTFDPDKTDK